VTRTVAAVLTWLSLAAVVIVAGGHAVYYLLEWEWMRAQIAATAFVAALVVGASLVILSRLREIERRLDALADSTQAVRVAAETSDPEPRPDFAWLAPVESWSGLTLPLLAMAALHEPEGAVFIPVFLATGIAVSVVASAVERVAAHRHASVASRAGRATTGPARRPVSTSAAIAIPLAGALVIGAVVGGLWIGAHYWSEPIGAGTTTMSVLVEHNGPTTTDTDVVEIVGRYCVLNAGVTVRFGAVTPGPDGSTLLRLNPLLDDDAQRRFTGCLEDAVLEWHQLEVTGTDLAPR
jgi:hypothetical protein